MKRIFCSAVSAVMLVGTIFPAMAYADAETGFSWNYEDKVLTISGEGAVPGYEDGEAPWSEYTGEIRTVLIKDEISEIGYNAFKDMRSLKNVEISSGLSRIGENAFAGCEKLAAVVLPDSVTEVASNAFLPETAVCVSETSAFANKEGYKTYTGGVWNDAVLSSDKSVSWAVYGGDTLVISGNGGMYNQFNNSGSDYAPWSSCHNDLQTVVVEYGITALPISLLGKDKVDPDIDTKKEYYPAIKTVVIGDTVPLNRPGEISGCTNIERYDVSYACRQINGYTLGTASGQTNGQYLKELFIPKNVKKDGSGPMLCGMPSLERLEFEEGFDGFASGNVNEWTTAYIRSAPKLKSITIPYSVTQISDYSFTHSGSLERVEILNPDTEVADNAFYNCSKNMTVVLYQLFREIYRNFCIIR